MKLFKTPLLLLLLLFVSSCTNKETSNPSEFEAQADLNPVQVKLNGNEILNPSSISVVDSSLIIVENGAESGIINSFSLQNFDFENSYGTRGRGPNEFSENIQNPVSVVGSNSQYIHLFDWINKRLIKLNTGDLSNDSIDNTINQYVLPPDLMLAQSAAFLNDSTVVAMGGIFEGLLAYANTNSDKVRFINPYPLNNDEISNRDLSELYMGKFAINTAKNTIAMASKYIPEILIIDFEGNVVRKISTSEFDLREIVNTPVDERTIFFQDIRATEDYIYAVHIGSSLMDLQEVMDNSVNSDSTAITEIHVYDWQGNPIKKLILNGGYYPFVTIDKYFDRIFTKNAFSPETNIVYFNTDMNLK